MQFKPHSSITFHSVFNDNQVRKIIYSAIIYFGIGATLTAAIFFAWFISLLIA